MEYPVIARPTPIAVNRIHQIATTILATPARPKSQEKP